MKVIELVREYERSLTALVIVAEEAANDEEIAKTLKVTAYYMVELAKRWGDGRTMPIEKAIKKSDDATKRWLRKRADQELAKELKKASQLSEALAQSPETPQETSVTTTPSPETEAPAEPSGPEESKPDPQTAPPDHEASSASSPSPAAAEPAEAYPPHPARTPDGHSLPGSPPTPDATALEGVFDRAVAARRYGPAPARSASHPGGTGPAPPSSPSPAKVVATQRLTQEGSDQESEDRGHTRDPAAPGRPPKKE